MRVRLIQVEERKHASSARNVEKRLQRLESTPSATMPEYRSSIQVWFHRPALRFWKKVSRTCRDALEQIQSSKLWETRPSLVNPVQAFESIHNPISSEGKANRGKLVMSQYLLDETNNYN
ncbi:hypothetical protein ACFX1S_019784 [Malus domestica]